MMLLIFPLDITWAAANEENVGYSVRAIIPENQINRHNSYFDLRVKPKQAQEIQVEIFNSSNQDSVIDVHITNPITNRNGLIDYTNVEAKPDQSLKVPITEIASINEGSVGVQAGQSRIVPIKLNIPEEEFEGIILGGIYFEKRLDEDTKEKANGVQISNQYSYVIGLKLSEKDTEVGPNLQLKNIKPDLVNYRTAVIATIQNKAPVIVENLSLNAVVFNAKGKEESRMDVEGYRMAPNSSMEYVIDWKNRELDPGTYTVSLHANSGADNWEWKEEFVIPKEEAQVLNEKAVEIKKDYTLHMVIGFSSIIIILLFVIFGLLRKNKSKTEQ